MGEGIFYLASLFIFPILAISAENNISKIFTEAAKKAVSAVVYIEADENQGSGFFIKPDGTLMTNAHIVAGCSKIRVVTFDKHLLPAEMIDLNSRTDIAVLKVKGTDFPYLTFGNSDELDIGELVLSVGYSVQSHPSFTLGIVNALDICCLGMNFIQTNTMMSLGNSGGPLLNAKGEVIGINTATRLSDHGPIGDTLSISSNWVKKILIYD